MSTGRLNLPNRLTVLRLCAVPVFVVLAMPREILRIPNDTACGILRLVALVLAILIALTDWLDGRIARARNLVTSFGTLMDPLADKIFVTAALLVLVQAGIVPAWAATLVIAREFLVTGLRSLAAERGRLIPADRLGKHKMAWQVALILLGLGLLAARDLHAGGGVQLVLHGAVWLALGVTMVLTVASGWQYVARNRDLLSDH